jgi:hypothetical protein
MKLIVEQGNLAGREISLEQAVSIGRGGDNDVVLPEQGVSRFHARLEPSPQGWLLTDLGSTNGTYVNGQRLPGHEAYLLQSGDRVTIGSSVLTMQHGEKHPPGLGVEEGRRAARRTGRPPARTGGRPAPAVMVAGALGLIVVLVGIVILLVLILKPAEAPPTPTAVDPMQHMLTALPLPTGFEDMMTAVVTVLPPGLPIPFLGGTPTPTPEAAVPGRELVARASIRRN